MKDKRCEYCGKVHPKPPEPEDLDKGKPGSFAGCPDRKAEVGPRPKGR